MRLALACAIAQGADVFLLDEPTNHLDSVDSHLQGFLPVFSKPPGCVGIGFGGFTWDFGDSTEGLGGLTDGVG